MKKYWKMLNTKYVRVRFISHNINPLTGVGHLKKIRVFIVLKKVDQRKIISKILSQFKIHEAFDFDKIFQTTVSIV